MILIILVHLTPNKQCTSEMRILDRVTLINHNLPKIHVVTLINHSLPKIHVKDTTQTSLSIVHDRGPEMIGAWKEVGNRRQ